MRLPFDRERLKQRNALDREDELASARGRSPAEGILEVIELSEVVARLSAATGAARVADDDLEEKARLYVRPLLAARRS